MSQQVQELIDKIKLEGVQAADQKAKAIEEQAQKKAQGILNEADKRAQELLARAEENIKKKQEASRLALQQASRDTLLSLKTEIQKLLQKIVTTQVADALTTQKLADIIAEISLRAIEAKPVDSGIEIALNPKDLKEVRDGFIAKFQKQLQQPVEFKAAEDVGKGFTISFDRGKSSFDFSQEALAEYLSLYLNEEMASLLK